MWQWSNIFYQDFSITLKLHDFVLRKIMFFQITGYLPGSKAASLTKLHTNYTLFINYWIDCLVQDCYISGVLTMEILQSCTKPIICLKLFILCWSHLTDNFLYIIHLCLEINSQCGLHCQCSNCQPFIHTDLCQHRKGIDNTLQTSAISFIVTVIGYLQTNGQQCKLCIWPHTIHNPFQSEFSCLPTYVTEKWIRGIILINSMQECFPDNFVTNLSFHEQLYLPDLLAN